MRNNIFSQKKVVVFGEEAVGKSSLVMTSCFGYTFNDIQTLKPTKGICIENLLFRGLVKINIWDCAGQERYLDQHFSDVGKQRIFSDIDSAIFVMDASRPETLNDEYVNEFMDIVTQYNPDIGKIYIFVNKMDIANESIFKQQTDLVYGILEKFPNGFVEIINCSVRTGTAKERFIKTLDAIIWDDDETIKKKKFFSDCLKDLQNAIEVSSDMSLYHLPSGLLVTSTLPNNSEDIEENCVILKDIINLEKYHQATYLQSIIVKINNTPILFNRIGKNSIMLIIIRSLVPMKNPEKILTRLREHSTFFAIGKILSS